MAFDPLTAGLDLAKTLIDAIVSRIPDPNERERERARLEEAAQAAQNAQLQAQLEVNKAEAANPSVFVAGWRPAAGWVSVGGLAYNSFIQPLLAWAASMARLPAPPPVDSDTFMFIITGMLGLGGWRSLDKIRGVATSATAPLSRVAQR